MKFNWGIRITIFYSAFALFLVANALFSSFQTSDLVEQDYFERGTVFQNKIDDMARTKRLKEPLKISINEKDILIEFPGIFKDLIINGNIHLYRPSNADYDREYAISLVEGTDFRFETSNIHKGYYKLKIHWSVNDSGYYHEENLLIN